MQDLLVGLLALVAAYWLAQKMVRPFKASKKSGCANESCGCATSGPLQKTEG